MNRIENSSILRNTKYVMYHLPIYPIHAIQSYFQLTKTPRSSSSTKEAPENQPRAYMTTFFSSSPLLTLDERSTAGLNSFLPFYTGKHA